MNLAIQNDYQIKRIIDAIIARAIEVWPANAPRNTNNELYRDIFERLKNKSDKFIEKVFELLKETECSQYFPRPAKWKKAIDQIQSETKSSRADFNDEDDTSLIQKKKIISNIHKFFETSSGSIFKKQKCDGGIFESSVVSNDGIGNYLSEIYSMQMSILGEWIGGREQRVVVELEGSGFYAWVRSRSFRDKVLSNGYVDINMVREEDLKAILDFAMKRKNAPPSVFDKYFLNHIGNNMCNILKENQIKSRS